MSYREYSNLGKALTTPPGPHLNEETIAELAYAEVSGDDIDVLFPLEVEHLESCTQCADNYGELVDLMISTVEGMSETALLVKPLDVFTEILIRETEERTGPQPALSEIVHDIAVSLPPLFTNPPISPSEVKLEEIESSAKKLSERHESNERLVITIMQIIQRNLAALGLFLRGSANSVWGRGLSVATATTEAWQTLQFQSTQTRLVPTLSEEGADREWQLLSKRLGDPLPLNITAWAERISPLACKINIKIDRPGLTTMAERTVQLRYLDQVMTVETDSSGVAIFETVPIAAIPIAEIRLRNE